MWLASLRACHRASNLYGYLLLYLYSVKPVYCIYFSGLFDSLLSKFSIIRISNLKLQQLAKSNELEVIKSTEVLLNSRFSSNKAKPQPQP